MTKADAAKRIILDDIDGILHAFQSCKGETRTHFMLGGLLYFSTIICNAVDWCRKANIDITCYSNTDILEKLRAKIKLYSSDKAIPFPEQHRVMSEIIRVEQQYWIDANAKSRIRRPKLLISDLGVYTINGHYIGNTIEYAYEYSPLNPARKPILDALSRNEATSVYQFAVGIGATLQELYTKIAGASFELNDINGPKIEVKSHDYRMSLQSLFKSEDGIFALNLLCRMNYLLEFFLPLCSSNPFLSFRMMYITYYHLKKDLKNLHLDFVYYDMPFKNKTFRNAMAHYSLHGKLSDSEIDENAIGFGLFEKYFNEPFDVVNKALEYELIQTRNSLEKYVRI